jgi:hypothetical protein
MKPTRINIGVSAIADRLGEHIAGMNERKCRHMIDCGLVRTFYVRKRRAATDQTIAEDVAALESMNGLSAAANVEAA